MFLLTPAGFFTLVDGKWTRDQTPVPPRWFYYKPTGDTKVNPHPKSWDAFPDWWWKCADHPNDEPAARPGSHVTYADVCRRLGPLPDAPWSPRGYALIYALVDPVDGDVRYVGATRLALAKRLAGHLKRPVNRGVERWICDLRRRGHVPQIRALQMVPEGDADQQEIRWIALVKAGGWRLLNVDPGGNHRTNRGAVRKKNVALARYVAEKVKRDEMHEASTSVKVANLRRQLAGFLRLQKQGRSRGDNARRIAQIQDKLRKLGVDVGNAGSLSRGQDPTAGTCNPRETGTGSVAHLHPHGDSTDQPPTFTR